MGRDAVAHEDDRSPRIPGELLGQGSRGHGPVGSQALEPAALGQEEGRVHLPLLRIEDRTDRTRGERHVPGEPI